MRRGWSLPLLMLLLLTPADATAQQTIINVPSVDQTPKGQFFALHESATRPGGEGAYWLSTNFLTYGVTSGLEAAVTAYNLGSYAAPNSAIGVGWKGARRVLPSRLPAWELTLGAGQMLQTNLRGGGVGLWSYGQASLRIPGAGLRLMGGVSAGPRQLFGVNTVHFIGSAEWPVASHVNLLAEWFSGRHDLADFVPGVSWHGGKTLVVLGWKFSNAPGTAGDGLIVEVGRFF